MADRNVSLNNVTMMNIQAYSFSSDYRVPAGYHCMVVTENKDTSSSDFYCWNNFGRSWGYPGAIDVNVHNAAYKEWLLKFCPTNNIGACGVSLNENGVCQTCAARELLVGQNDVSLSVVSGNDECLVWYGKYGLGIQTLKDLLTKSYNETATIVKLPDGCLDTVMRRIDNTTKEELEAWYRVGKKYTNIPFDDLINRNRGGAVYQATSRLNAWVKERENIYAEYKKSGTSNIKSLNSQLRARLLELIKEYLVFLNAIGYISSSDVDNYYQSCYDLFTRYTKKLAEIRMLCMES